MDDDNVSETVVGEICLALSAPPLGDGSGLDDQHSSLAVVLMDRSAVEALERRLCELAADVTSEYLASTRPGTPEQSSPVRPLSVSVDDAFQEGAAQYIVEHREGIARQVGYERLELIVALHCGTLEESDLMTIRSLSVLLPPGGIEPFIKQLERGDFYAPADPEHENEPCAAATATRSKLKKQETVSVDASG